jgi:hypothetical protein
MTPGIADFEESAKAARYHQASSLIDILEEGWEEIVLQWVI